MTMQSALMKAKSGVMTMQSNVIEGRHQ